MSPIAEPAPMDGVVCLNARDAPDTPMRALDVGALYKTELPRLCRLAAGMGLSRSDAEDALHDSYVALLEHQSIFTGPEAAARWLTRVLLNRCLLCHRRAQRWRRITGIWFRPDRTTAPASTDAADAVRQTLQELRPDQSAVLVLRYFCDYNATQIADLLSIPASTVRSHLRNARLQLARRLIAKGLAHDTGPDL